MAAALHYGIPARGTFSHAFVTFYADSKAGTGEENAFRDYIRCYPNDAIILVDSFDALEGVRRACKNQQARKYSPERRKVGFRRFSLFKQANA